MTIPADLKYSSTHEWIRTEADGTVTVGITHHAQSQLGDIVFVQNPEVGRTLAKDEECGVVESVKAAADIYTPIAGEIVAVNADLDAAPQKLNEDPYGAWMFRLKPSEPSQIAGLMDAQAYASLAEADKG